ncbi:tetratricopeptide repeat protein [bacterium]|nr:tetratricopeptide repeat protein [bacterium]
MKKGGLLLVLLWLLFTYIFSFGCTIFTTAEGDLVLVGNNEDWKNPNTKVWFKPAEEGKYGRVYFGFDNFFPQGGVNDQGLCFDWTATQLLEVENSADKPVYEGNLIEKVMEECATVDEALALLDQFSKKFFERAQLMIVDKTGDAAIVEGDIIHRKEGKYQILTNFYQSQYEPDSFPCTRYKIADRMLSENENISIDLFRKILSAVHQEGDWGGTQYSNIYDLNAGLIYLYHFHNFEDGMLIEIDTELAKGENFYDIPMLFPDNFAYISYKETVPIPIAKVLYEIIHEQGIKDALKEYNRLKEEESEKYDFGEWIINGLGYKLLYTDKRIDDAIEIFKLNVKEYPDAYNTYDSLGEAFMVKGNKKKAVKYYRESLDLNPNNTNAVKMLEKLES